MTAGRVCLSGSRLASRLRGLTRTPTLPDTRLMFIWASALKIVASLATKRPAEIKHEQFQRLYENVLNNAIGSSNKQAKQKKAKHIIF